MIYREDELAFTKPLLAEADDLRRRLNTPITKSQNADEVLGQLQAERAAYNTFLDDLSMRVDRGTFWGLTGIREGIFTRSTRYRMMEHGPYRGIFLVDIPSDTTLGLSFSKEPHVKDMRGKIKDITARWQDGDFGEDQE